MIGATWTKEVIVGVPVRKSTTALARTGLTRLVVAGGGRSTLLRMRLRDECEKREARVSRWARLPRFWHPCFLSLHLPDSFDLFIDRIVFMSASCARSMKTSVKEGRAVASKEVRRREPVRAR